MHILPLCKLLSPKCRRLNPIGIFCSFPFQEAGRHPEVPVLPFQTPEFNPADPQLVQRVERSPRLHEGFHINGSGHDVDGERWILLGTEGLTPGITLVAYPLPASYGEEIHWALSRFQDEWKIEADRMGLVARYQERLAETHRRTVESAAARLAALPKPRRPKPRPHDLEGAVALPGFEGWIKPGKGSA